MDTILYSSQSKVFAGVHNVRCVEFKAGSLFDKLPERVLHRHQPRRSRRTIKNHVEPVFFPAVGCRRPFIRADMNVPLAGTPLYLNSPAHTGGTVARDIKTGMQRFHPPPQG